MILANTLTGPDGAQVTNARLAESAQTGTVTIQNGGTRAVYTDTHTIYGQPGIRLHTGGHRGETPRLRVTLPSSGPWSARWYTWVPSLLSAGHGSSEIRTLAVLPTHALTVQPTGGDNVNTRLQVPDLAASPLLWDSEDGAAVALAQWLRVEVRWAGGALTTQIFGEHATTGARVHTWGSLPDPGRVLDVTGYRWRRRPLLMWGDQGAQVAALQNELLDLGYSLGPWGADGDFGEGTHNVVMDFQRDYGLTPVDGAAGPETRAAMDMALGLVPPPVYLSHLAVSDGAWIGPAEPPPEPPEIVRRGFTVGIPI